MLHEGEPDYLKSNAAYARKAYFYKQAFPSQYERLAATTVEVDEVSWWKSITDACRADPEIKALLKERQKEKSRLAQERRRLDALLDADTIGLDTYYAECQALDQ
jgi:hypothetical protein